MPNVILVRSNHYEGLVWGRDEVWQVYVIWSCFNPECVFKRVSTCGSLNKLYEWKLYIWIVDTVQLVIHRCFCKWSHNAVCHVSCKRCCLCDCWILFQLDSDLNCVGADICQSCCRQTESENVRAFIKTEDVDVVGRVCRSDRVFPWSTIIKSVFVSCYFADRIGNSWESLSDGDS